ncbi:AbgT family transporter [Pseudonocardia alni]|uniref:AbgT family transporter n=1 Tax=Pseudonocardia alni TaxID=33907 RepID=UPI0033D9DF06
MSEGQQLSSPPHATGLTRFLDRVERVGNRLPHPVWLFAILAGVVALLSAVLSAAGLSVIDPQDGTETPVRSVLSADGIRTLLLGAEESYTGFGPLGIVLVIMLGIAVANQSGLFEAVVRRGLAGVRPRYVVFATCIAGSLASLLSMSAYLVVVPLAAAAFQAVGRSPMLGMIVAFLSINAAADASPLIAPGDVVLSRIATDAVQIVDPDMVVRPTDNMLFTTVSAIVLAITLTVVVETVLAKREHELVPDPGAEGPLNGGTGSSVPDAVERRALRITGAVALGFVLLVALTMVPTSSPLRGENGEVLDSALIQSIAVVLFFFTFTLGVTYARLTGRLDSWSDLPPQMAEGVRSVAPLLVLFFAVSQFLAVFSYTNISTALAVSGADLLRQLNAPVLAVLLALIACLAVMNLVITSGTAMWALVAPAIIPMTYLIGANPATVLAAYRIADSCTNSITPMSPTFMLTVGFLQMYRRRAGIGTLVSFTLPAALVMLVVWTVLFIGWYALGLPLGPGSPVHP